ncbi:MAG: Choline-sulfatase [candidate division BRC1 bacterium ADurb.BinA364]|nr:MAG: Choline-sulfatase [candidate division BRC1 bacterium ADurb.BinA364]
MFARHYASEVPTPPSYTSLFHGRRAIKNGIYTFQQYVREFSCPTPSLAQRFYLKGYRTGAISNLAQVYPWLHAGFMDIYKPGNRFQGGTADEVTREALRWLREFGKGDFFLFAHYWDPHVPYLRRSQEEYRRMFRVEEYRGRAPGLEYYERNPAMMQAYREKHERLGDPHDPAENLALYDANIRFADDQVRALFDGMKALGLDPDEICVVFTSDHGEAFGEYGFCDHYSLYRNISQVPLIVRGPAARPGRVEAYTQHVDLLPTLCDLAGLDLEDSLCGQSLAPLLAGGTDGPRDYAMVETAFGAVQRMLVRDERALVHTLWNYERDYIREYELFDLRSDPDQVHDIAAQNRDLTERMRIEMEDWVIKNAGGGAKDKLRLLAAKRTMADVSFLIRK